MYKYIMWGIVIEYDYNKLYDKIALSKTLYTKNFRNENRKQ